MIKHLQETPINRLEMDSKCVDINGFALPQKYGELKSGIEGLEVSEKDVWVCTFPKSGTTWIQEMVWMIVNNLDLEQGKKNLSERSPFVEFSLVQGNMTNHQLPLHIRDSVAYYKTLESPIVAKTHLPLHFLPEKVQKGVPKIIYVIRDPKDVCVSYYHHHRIFQQLFDDDFDTFCDSFLAGKCMYAPYWDHVFSYLQIKNLPNFLLLRYEDVKRDTKKVIKEVSAFLGCHLSEEQVEALEQHVSFESMKKNPAVNKEKIVKVYQRLGKNEPEEKFMRSGKVGDHRSAMSEEMIKKFDEWTRENIGRNEGAAENVLAQYCQNVE